MGWKVLGLSLCVIIGAAYGLKVEFFMHKMFKKKMDAHNRALLLKEIEEEGIVEKILKEKKP